MSSDAFGVIMVLVLAGLVMPIALLIGAALVDVLVFTWAAGRIAHDGLASGLHRLTHHAPAVPPIRPGLRG